VSARVEPFNDDGGGAPVRGVVHRPAAGGADACVLTHGAGSNREAPVLRAVAEALSGRGMTVLRCDRPFRQARPKGPPSPAWAARDRDGLRRAVELVRARCPGRIVLGGSSYGGRQASMLAAEHSGLVDALLLLAYPLHAPGRPESPRAAHFSAIRAPTLFVHGTRDPFATIEELDATRAALGARSTLLVVEGAGHDLGGGRTAFAGRLPDALAALLDAARTAGR
jgi:predicted alpha/beta-hydrolase family hydrolase